VTKPKISYQNNRRTPVRQNQTKMDQLFHLHNQGVCFSASCQVPQALSCFTKALQWVEDALRQMDQQGWRTADETAEHLRVVPTPIQAPLAAMPVEIFNQVFQIFPSHDSVFDNEGMASTIAFFAAVIRYNMAVTLQVQLTGTKSSGGQKEQQVFRLYKTCLRAVEPFHSFAGPNVLSLSMACLYNLAELLFARDHIQRASEMVALADKLLWQSLDLGNYNGQPLPLLFSSETLNEFAWKGYLIPYCASLQRSAPAA